MHGRILTSAGSAAGIDLLIEIVRQDFAMEVANSVAQRLVMPAHRIGGQAQFLERPVPARHQSEVAPLFDRMRADFGAPWTLKRMASECRMSLRTFVRRFIEATGSPPGEWRRPNACLSNADTASTRSLPPLAWALPIRCGIISAGALA